MRYLAHVQKCSVRAYMRRLRKSKLADHKKDKGILWKIQTV